MKFTYLLINLASFILPFLFTFHPRLRFDRRWKSFIPVLIIVAIVFSVWDFIFVRKEVWGFHDDYILGISILTLPLEEVLFFICIPYACLFTYHCFGLFLPKGFLQEKKGYIAISLAIMLALAAIIFRMRLYTAVTFSLLSVMLILLSSKNYIGPFFLTFIVLLIPFFIVNGILTGTGLEKPVVWYNEEEITGLRLLTIPVEDAFYGMLLILLNVAGMEWLDKKK